MKKSKNEKLAEKSWEAASYYGELVKFIFLSAMVTWIELKNSFPQIEISFQDIFDKTFELAAIGIEKGEVVAFSKTKKKPRYVG